MVGGRRRPGQLARCSCAPAAAGGGRRCAGRPPLPSAPFVWPHPHPTKTAEDDQKRRPQSGRGGCEGHRIRVRGHREGHSVSWLRVEQGAWRRPRARLRLVVRVCRLTCVGESGVAVSSPLLSSPLLCRVPADRAHTPLQYDRQRRQGREDKEEYVRRVDASRVCADFSQQVRMCRLRVTTADDVSVPVPAAAHSYS